MAAVSLFTAERTIARSGMRVAGFSQTPKMKRVRRSPMSSTGPSARAAGALSAGAAAISTAASKTCSLVPK